MMNRKNNKKIKGTTPKEFKNIKFKSILECTLFKKLYEANLNPKYESETIVLWKGPKITNVKNMGPSKKRIGNKIRLTPFMEDQASKLRDITYTPDYVVTKKDYKIYFDAKGFANDVYPLKKKMFLKVLSERNDGWKYIFFEPHNVRQINQAINIIKGL